MKCVLQYYEKKLCYVKGKQNCNLLPNCEIGDKVLSKSVQENM